MGGCGWMYVTHMHTQDGNLLHWCPTHMPTPTASDPTKLRYQPRRLVPTAHEYPSLKALIINIADQSTRPTRPTAVPRRFDTTMSF